MTATFDDVFAANADREVFVAVSAASNNYTLAVAERDGSISVSRVPSTISNAEVIRKLNSLTVWPLDGYSPRVLDWSAIANLRPGQLLRTRRVEGRGVVTSDLPHWTGEYSIGA